ncbi:hypothetical protein jhhlp_008788 [Lomentospora prolificans]|uniref:Uncharacterized protein n=1 Tax=Lomentospora prolificans TaxID=41688 RepID=A0A2N3MZ17_9PEZI|nr:hypothetical protein jhhlp_008788 [Lomentospora prolificans]
MDGQFNHYKDQWKGFCTSHRGTITVDEPSLITPAPVTSFKNKCSYIKSACNRHAQYTSDCQLEFADNLSACYCQTHVVQMESVCSVDGVAMCSQPPIQNQSTIWGAASCGGYQESSFLIPDWALVDARVDAPTTVPFADFPLTYNDVPTLEPSASGAPGSQMAFLSIILSLMLFV